MSLNLNNIGSPLCIVDGGKYDGKLVSASADKEDEKDDGVFKSFSQLNLQKDAKFKIYPDSKLERQIGYISGASGAGKSTFVKAYVENYRKIYPKNPVFLLSRLGEDKSIDLPYIKRIKLDEQFYTDPLSVEDFSDSLVISDDIDTIKNPKELKQAITALIDSILEVGRHYRCSMLVTSHVVTRSVENRNIINEAHFVTLFLKSSSTYTYFLQQYMGFNLKQIRKLKKIDSRAVTINRQYPNTVIGERVVMLATELDDVYAD